MPGSGEGRGQSPAGARSGQPEPASGISQPSRCGDLILERGVGTILLALSPLFVGALLAYHFRGMFDRSKGVVLVRIEGDRDWLRAESPVWPGLLLENNPEP